MVRVTDDFCSYGLVVFKDWLERGCEFFMDLVWLFQRIAVWFSLGFGLIFGNSSASWIRVSMDLDLSLGSVFLKGILVFNGSGLSQGLGFSKGRWSFSGSGYLSLLTIQRCYGNGGFET